jgi:hypothetical protein
MSSLPPVSVPSILEVPHMPLSFSPSTFKVTRVYCAAGSFPMVAIQLPETSAAMQARVNTIAPARAAIFIHCFAIILLLSISLLGSATC